MDRLRPWSEWWWNEKRKDRSTVNYDCLCDGRFEIAAILIVYFDTAYKLKLLDQLASTSNRQGRRPNLRPCLKPIDWSMN